MRVLGGTEGMRVEGGRWRVEGGNEGRREGMREGGERGVREALM